MALAVDFEKGLVVGADNVDAEPISLGALGVEGPSAALVIARHGDADHVATHRADIGIATTAINEVDALHTLIRQIVGAFGPQHVA